jgi:hypothetical protein
VGSAATSPRRRGVESRLVAAVALGCHVIAGGRECLPVLSRNGRKRLLRHLASPQSSRDPHLLLRHPCHNIHSTHQCPHIRSQSFCHLHDKLSTEMDAWILGCFMTCSSNFLPVLYVFYGVVENVECAEWLCNQRYCWEIVLIHVTNFFVYWLDMFLLFTACSLIMVVDLLNVVVFLVVGFVVYCLWGVFWCTVSMLISTQHDSTQIYQHCAIHNNYTHNLI